MTEVESKFIIMARIAVELSRQGKHCYLGFKVRDCYLTVSGECVYHSCDYTEQELLDWLEELQGQKES